MEHQQHRIQSNLNLGAPRTDERRSAAIVACALAFAIALTFATPNLASAQTYSVIHTFNKDPGANPLGGVTIDPMGNLDGTTFAGGGGTCQWTGGLATTTGCGSAFQLKPNGLFTTLFQFAGGNDAAGPAAGLVYSGGTLYGTSTAGGTDNCTFDGVNGCGTVFSLLPPVSPPRSIQENHWIETILYRFMGTPDAAAPNYIVVDSHGNIFGCAYSGGAFGAGAVFKLTHSFSGWTEQVVYSFTGGTDGSTCVGVLAIDSLGNLYGTASSGGQYGYGAVFELSPSGSGYTETVLYSFGAPGANGVYPSTGLIFDRSGNLYGATQYFQAGGGGPFRAVVFELSPSNGSWTYQEIYDLPGAGSGDGPEAPLSIDTAGNLYGSTSGGACDNHGDMDCGTVFKLALSNGSWQYTLEHQFVGGSDGALPIGIVSFDANGNLFGTCVWGGNIECGNNGLGCGVVWKITP